MLYQVLLYSHSWLRWVALVLVVVSIVLAAQKRNDVLAKKLSIFTMISMHLQLVFGLVLYVWLSPTTQAAFADFGAAMKDRALRSIAVEHLTLMLIAIALVTVGHIRGKRAASDAAAAKSRLIFFAIGLVVLLAGIPWHLALFRF